MFNSPCQYYVVIQATHKNAENFDQIVFQIKYKTMALEKNFSTVFFLILLIVGAGALIAGIFILVIGIFNVTDVSESKFYFFL